MERNVYKLPVNETSDQILSYPPIGTWTFGYYFTPGRTTPDVTQTVRTRARAATLGEVSQQLAGGISVLAVSALDPLKPLLQPQTPSLTSLLLPLNGLCTGQKYKLQMT